MDQLPHESPDPRHVDTFVTLHGISWEQYEAFLAMRGESSALRVTYLKGELEIMAPSTHHERLKTRLARLVEAWSEEMDVPLEGVGSWTVKKKDAERAAEPDECYVIGEGPVGDRPDFAIEVVWTSGGIDKLEVWRLLGVPEVWFWKDGALTFYALRGYDYVEIDCSALLPDFDHDLVVRCMAAESQLAAVKQLRKELRSGG